ncbi:MAG: EAL domain-containing protein, partial [Thermodesulfobacteriota bacterium]
LHAELLNKLSSFQPKGVAMDIVFAEPDLSAPGDDELLALAIAKNSPVVLPILLEQSSASSGLRETLPLKEISLAAAGLGHVDTEMDSDGIARSVYLRAGLGEARWPFFALALLQVTEDFTEDSVLPGQRNPAPLSDERFWVRDHHVFVPFSGPDGTFQQVSFIDVLADHVSPQQLTGKYILVGATATGLGDTIPTPVSAQSKPMSGVEFNANVLNALLEERLIVQLPAAVQLSITLFVVLLAVLPFIVFGPRRSSLWGGMLLISLLLFSYLALVQLHSWFPPATALFTILIGYMLIYRHYLRDLLRSLFKERQRSKTALTSIDDAILRTDHRGRIVDINHAAQRFCRVPAARAIGKPIWEVLQLHSRHDNKLYPLQKCIDETIQRRPKPLLLTDRQGEEILVQLAITPVPDAHKEQREMIVVITDISEAHKLSKQIIYHETHNQLTGLPNATLIQEKLRKTIKRQLQSTAEHLLAIIHIDIERFSIINESLGNSTTERLLQEVAKRLQSFEHEGEAVAGHIGTNEFALILGNIQDRGSIMELLASVRELLAESSSFLDRKFSLTFSMGVSLFPEDSLEAEVLCRQANSAMHRAKESGRGKTQLFTQNMQARANRLFEVENLLQRAVEKQHLVTLYQPLIKTDTLQIVGVEALMRLRDEQGEYFSPDEFIPVAEESGILVELGYYQLKQACRQLVAWKEQGISPLRLSVNLSPQQLKVSNLVSRVEQILSTTGFEPQLLEFEITENIFLEDDRWNRQVMEQLRRLGAEFAIDDFGTGYSSMNYLTRFPFNRVKIDRSLVRDLSIKPGSSAITSAIINLVNSLDMLVIAEGVEQPSQYETLLAQGCDELQGFALGRPMPAKEFHSLYKGCNGRVSIC